MNYLVKNFHGEKREVTNKKEYEYLITGKADIAPKGKIVK